MSSDTIQYVKPAIQNYGWGSKGGGPVALSSSVNGYSIDPSKEYAEAWFGAHPTAPSHLVSEKGGKEEQMPKTANVPLLKFLGIRAPLSIQLHPDQGSAPFLHSSFPSIYKDPGAKPEMVVAITPLRVMMGIRSYDELKKSAFAIPSVAKFLGEKLKETDDVDLRESEVSRILCKWMLLTSEEAAPIVKQAMVDLPSCQGVGREAEVMRQLNKSFPDDVGVLAPLFLNVLDLVPGDALFVSPNTLHAYIDGDAVEIMNSSDNVIRAGLTPKLRDAKLLCNLLTAEEKAPKLTQGEQDQETSVGHFSVLRPVPFVHDFELSHYSLDSNAKVKIKSLPVNSMLLCSNGHGVIHLNHTSLEVTQGQCIWIPANTSPELSSLSSSSFFRANTNQAGQDTTKILSEITQLVLETGDIKQGGDQNILKAEKAAGLLRPIEVYVHDVWLRAALFANIGLSFSTSPKHKNAAERWMKKYTNLMQIIGSSKNPSKYEIDRLTTQVNEAVAKLS